jgi:ribosomal protein S28E/S33
MQAVVQVGVVDIEAQTPALDVHLYRAGLLIKALERTQAQGGVTQLLVNLSGSQGRHRCLRRDGGMGRIGPTG